MPAIKEKRNGGVIEVAIYTVTLNPSIDYCPVWTKWKLVVSIVWTVMISLLVVEESMLAVS